MKKKIITSAVVTFASVASLAMLAGCSTGSDSNEPAETTVLTETAEVTEEVTTAEETSAEETSTDATEEGETTSADTTDTAATGEGAAEADGLSPIDNGKVASENLEVEIKGYKVVPAGVGGAENSLDPVVVFYYDVTNLSDKEIDANSA